MPKIIVIMPAYNAAGTLEQTYRDIPFDLVHSVILVDDVSQDDTVEIARRLGLKVVVHVQNRGYGGNQKTCYRLALEDGADIVIMVHPDYQYTPRLIPAMASMLGSGLYDCVLASRILGGHALRGGMPLWRYVANRFLTLAENLLMGAKLSEFHTGYRAFTRELLEVLPLEVNSDDFFMVSDLSYVTVAHNGSIISEASFTYQDLNADGRVTAGDSIMVEGMTEDYIGATFKVLYRGTLIGIS